jgi:hypothetical protein
MKQTVSICKLLTLKHNEHIVFNSLFPQEQRSISYQGAVCVSAENCVFLYFLYKHLDAYLKCSFGSCVINYVFLNISCLSEIKFLIIFKECILLCLFILFYSFRLNTTTSKTHIHCGY